MFKLIGKSLGYTVLACKSLGSVPGHLNPLKRSGDADRGEPKPKKAKKEKTESFKGVFTGGLRSKYGLNQSEVKVMISSLENKIRDLYLEIGKVGAHVEDESRLFENSSVKKLYEDIRKHEKEIFSLRKYQGALESSDKQQGTAGGAIPYTGFETKKQRLLESAIASCIRKASFPLRSEAVMFEKAMHDLLDDETDIKLLAISEIGRLGNKHAAPVLKEVLKLENPALQAEAINALIQLDDKEIFQICRTFFNHEYYAVRTACVRGLYKTRRKEAIPLLTTALQDENVEVRNSAAMFLGWLEASSAVVPLLQAARDKDKRVRKSAILSLANIRDENSVLSLIRLLDDPDADIREKVLGAISGIVTEPIDFNVTDVHNLSANVEKLKEWWLEHKHKEMAAVHPILEETKETQKMDEMVDKDEAYPD